MQLIECRAAANAQFTAQKSVIEELHERASDDEVLLYLSRFGPWRRLRPCHDVLGGNHSSISG
jgi:hypothetical protein